MRIPKLPSSVRIILKRHQDENGAPLVDVPVFVCRPVTMQKSASYSSAFATEKGGVWVTICMDHLTTIENLHVDGEPFDKSNQVHVDALEFDWCMEVGMNLYERTYLSQNEVGKSPSPSSSD